LDALLIELDVAPLALHRGEREAQGVRAVLVDQAERVDGIALGLGHLPALGVADETVEIERLPGPLAHELEALHRHARIPEEDDVEAGDEDVVRIMAAQFLGLLGPAERGEGPEGRGEPGVEHIGIAPDWSYVGVGYPSIHRLNEGIEDYNLSALVIPIYLLPEFNFIDSDEYLTTIRAARRIYETAVIPGGTIPGRDPAPPPELARDAPGLDILQPVEPGLP